MKQINVLVTGANGFVGSHILEALMRHEGVTPIAACRDRHKLTPAFHGEMREGDLRDKDYVLFTCWKKPVQVMRAPRTAGISAQSTLEGCHTHTNGRDGPAAENPHEDVQTH